ncbi:sugar ABC transporter ATP-binding protein [Caballeronia novacaledonica]|jgi:ribose transport system ATP-binding protein|uniref:Sugar ABC transporter ATP-binding protein n=2 Tax=Caballeronia novacaledonica TaxID=1544861 RepID=A0AA37IFW7_9BURK|nr:MULTISPECIES: sugar ABC transporter ATP-binding protein [Caballeronia]MDR5745436.1 sugar ABC transporter ATP-binding protein [Caballeronia sp. LZ029]GJH21993.1 sugar ABC transporter ATP-binding protein [Caballeronia novacaledonica]GJH29091.1 sugar ABC transporter ATP-binding protein [Caballeronia novacaledonica]
MAQTPLLDMQDIDIAFGGVAALKRARLSVAAGEVHALIGQNGAGKSTLIKILTGAYRKSAGTIRFDGREVDFRTPKDAREAGISTIYQEINLVPFRSVAENIFLGREPRRLGLIDWKTVQRRAAELLESFGLRIDVKKPVREYSTAIQQMVALARAVSSDAKLVIMDESTSSLDEREVELLFTVVRRLRDDGRAVIFVSHRLDELYALCDRVTVMRDGQTVAENSMQEMDKLKLVTTMLGRTLAAVVHEDSAVKEANLAKRGPVALSAQGLAAGTKVTDVSLDVHAGEAVGLAGLLGSGRTETMRLLFGADRPAKGALAVGGENAAFKSPKDAIARGIAYLTEDRKAEGIVPELSVRDNLTLVCLPALTKRGVVDIAKQREIVDGFVESLGIKLRSPDQPIRELSGGNQQKVLLARWLATHPRLLLLDEPTRGIDVGAKADVAKIVRELRDAGLAVLLSASELEELTAVADRAVVIRDGETVAQLDGAQMNEASIMDAIAYGAGAESTLAEAVEEAKHDR